MKPEMQNSSKFGAKKERKLGRREEIHVGKRPLGPERRGGMGLIIT